MKQSGIGHTTTLQFQQTKKYMAPLYERLKHRALHEELRAGLWMMVEVSFGGIIGDREHCHEHE